MTTAEAFETVSRARFYLAFNQCSSNPDTQAAIELLEDIQSRFVEELKGLRGEQLAQLGEDVLRCGGMAKGTA